jgi:hypothetical protein
MTRMLLKKQNDTPQTEDTASIRDNNYVNVVHGPVVDNALDLHTRSGDGCQECKISPAIYPQRYNSRDIPTVAMATIPRHGHAPR